MKTKITLLLAAVCGTVLLLSGCDSARNTRPPAAPDAAPFLQNYRAMTANVASQVGVIDAQADTLTTLTKGTPNEAPAKVAVAHVKTAAQAIVTALNDPKVDPAKLVALFQSALDEWNHVYAAQQKVIEDAQKPSTKVLVLLYGVAALCFVLIALAAFASSWLASIPLIGAWLDEVIGKHVMVLLGIIGGALIVIARFYAWACKHPHLFDGLILAGVATGVIVYVNTYNSGLFGQVWTWIKTKLSAIWLEAEPEIAAIETKVEGLFGEKSAGASAPAATPAATPAPASTAPAATFPAAAAAAPSAPATPAA